MTQLSLDLSAHVNATNARRRGGSPQLTAEVVRQRLGDRPIELVGELVNKDTPTLWKCKALNCGHEWRARPGGVLNSGTGCPVCARKRSGRKRLTIEDVRERLSGRAIKLVGDLRGSGVKTLWQCTYPECNHSWHAAPSDVLHRTGCPVCSNNRRGPERLTPKTVRRRLADRPIELIGEIHGSRTKTLWRCKSFGCGYEWSATPGQILNQETGCPRCSNRLQITPEMVRERLASRPIELIGELRGAKANTLWRCKKPGCQHEWITQPTTILNQGSGCPACAGCLPITADVVKSRLIGRAIKLIGEFRNSHDKALWQCTRQGCDHRWAAKVYCVVNNGSGCPACYRRSWLNPESVRHRLTGRSIELIGQLIGADHNALWRCTRHGCGNKWRAKPSKVLARRNPSGCPSCAVNGFDASKPATLYYLRIERQNKTPLYKIGVTNRTVEDRFRGRDLDIITIVKTWRFQDGDLARERERRLLHQHRASAYDGPDLLNNNGNSELFTQDVLGLDTALAVA